MKRVICILLLLLTLGLFLTGCKSKEEQQAEKIQKEIEDWADQLQKELGDY